MAKKSGRGKRVKSRKTENIGVVNGARRNIFTRSWVFPALILIMIVLALMIVPNLNRVQLSTPTCELAQYISSDYDNDGIPAICNSNGDGNDNCPMIYNPQQNNKYCNPFYGQVLNDDLDNDFIPNNLKYSSALGFYIGEISGQEKVYTDIKTNPVMVRINLTETPISRVLSSAEINKLAS